MRFDRLIFQKYVNGQNFGYKFIIVVATTNIKLSWPDVIYSSSNKYIIIQLLQQPYIFTLKMKFTNLQSESQPIGNVYILFIFRLNCTYVYCIFCKSFQ